MTDKGVVLEFIRSLPSDISLQEIVKELKFFVAVKEGLDEVDQGQGMSIEAAEQHIMEILVGQNNVRTPRKPKNSCVIQKWVGF